MSVDLHYKVLLTTGAEQDLDDIVGYVALNDSPAKADALLDKLLATAQTLSTAPHRGSVPRELMALGIREYRQTLFKPYRIFYTIQEQRVPSVVIVVIADGRRDLRTLLERRLLMSGP